MHQFIVVFVRCHHIYLMEKVLDKRYKKCVVSKPSWECYEIKIMNIQLSLNLTGLFYLISGYKYFHQTKHFILIRFFRIILHLMESCQDSPSLRYHFESSIYPLLNAFWIRFSSYLRPCSEKKYWKMIQFHQPHRNVWCILCTRILCILHPIIGKI